MHSISKVEYGYSLKKILGSFAKEVCQDEIDRKIESYSYGAEQNPLWESCHCVDIDITQQDMRNGKACD